MRNTIGKKIKSPLMPYHGENTRKSPRKKQVKQQDKGRRKLEFCADKKNKPLIGWTVFLDIQLQAKAAEIRKRIESLGGTVEGFLDKNISLVITSQKLRQKSEAYGEIPSPISCGPSPSPLQPLSNRYSMTQSPFSADSPQNSIENKKKPKSTTRGKSLLDKVLVSKRNACDVADKAKLFGLAIITVEEFARKYMKRRSAQEPDLSALKGKKNIQLLKTSRSRTVSDIQVFNLQETFFKIEDQSKAFRPIVFETKSWPNIYFHRKQVQSPFDAPKENKSENKRKTYDAELDEETISLEERSEGKSETEEENIETKPSHKADKIQDAKIETKTSQKAVKTRTSKPGYCDCCSVRYQDLGKHLKSDQHRHFAEDDTNFKDLDKLIDGGVAFGDFLQGLKDITKEKRERSTSQCVYEEIEDNATRSIHEYEVPSKSQEIIDDDLIKSPDDDDDVMKMFVSKTVQPQQQSAKEEMFIKPITTPLKNISRRNISSPVSPIITPTKKLRVTDNKLAMSPVSPCHVVLHKTNITVNRVEKDKDDIFQPPPLPRNENNSLRAPTNSPKRIKLPRPSTRRYSESTSSKLHEGNSQSKSQQRAANHTVTPHISSPSEKHGRLSSEANEIFTDVSHEKLASTPKKATKSMHTLRSMNNTSSPDIIDKSCSIRKSINSLKSRPRKSEIEVVEVGDPGMVVKPMFDINNEVNHSHSDISTKLSQPVSESPICRKAPRRKRRNTLQSSQTSSQMITTQDTDKEFEEILLSTSQKEAISSQEELADAVQTLESHRATCSLSDNSKTVNQQTADVDKAVVKQNTIESDMSDCLLSPDRSRHIENKHLSTHEQLQKFTGDRCTNAPVDCSGNTRIAPDDVDDNNNDDDETEISFNLAANPLAKECHVMENQHQNSDKKGKHKHSKKRKGEFCESRRNTKYSFGSHGEAENINKSRKNKKTKDVLSNENLTGIENPACEMLNTESKERKSSNEADTWNKDLPLKTNNPDELLNPSSKMIDTVCLLNERAAIIHNDLLLYLQNNQPNISTIPGGEVVTKDMLGPGSDEKVKRCFKGYLDNGDDSFCDPDTCQDNSHKEIVKEEILQEPQKMLFFSDDDDDKDDVIHTDAIRDILKTSMNKENKHANNTIHATDDMSLSLLKGSTPKRNKSKKKKKKKKQQRGKEGEKPSSSMKELYKLPFIDNKFVTEFNNGGIDNNIKKRAVTPVENQRGRKRSRTNSSTACPVPTFTKELSEIRNDSIVISSDGFEFQDDLIMNEVFESDNSSRKASGCYGTMLYDRIKHNKRNASRIASETISRSSSRSISPAGEKRKHASDSNVLLTKRTSPRKISKSRDAPYSCTIEYIPSKKIPPKIVEPTFIKCERSGVRKSPRKIKQLLKSPRRVSPRKTSSISKNTEVASNSYRNIGKKQVKTKNTPKSIETSKKIKSQNSKSPFENPQSKDMNVSSTLKTSFDFEEEAFSDKLLTSSRHSKPSGRKSIPSPTMQRPFGNFRSHNDELTNEKSSRNRAISFTEYYNTT